MPYPFCPVDSTLKSLYSWKGVFFPFQKVNMSIERDQKQAEHDLGPKDGKENFIFEKSLKGLGIEELQLIHRELSYLAKNFDPYSLGVTDQAVENLLDKYQFAHELENPFMFTNSMLQRLDQVEQLMKKKLQ